MTDLRFALSVLVQLAASLVKDVGVGFIWMAKKLTELSCDLRGEPRPRWRI